MTVGSRKALRARSEGAPLLVLDQTVGLLSNGLILHVAGMPGSCFLGCPAHSEHSIRLCSHS